MHSTSRSLALTAALLMAAAVSILLGAMPPKLDAAPAAAAPALLPAPISLSDPDGQELIIEDLSVRVAIHGM
ncbi:MAG TPA: hypothetical protein VNA04_12150, partial [Thermoanaerobaculia bacterium]|nr:hypothetical protein [Thermoanaerobaculia bacterium]